MGGNIFINYRRGDDPGFAQALFGRLEQVFKGDQLFMDIDDIAPGLDFVEVINQQVARCDVLISVIGRGWLTAVDEGGMRRLDDPQELVGLEIELHRRSSVSPVLVNDAKMPRLTDLPELLRPFARCNAVKLSHERFRADVAGLIESLEEVLGEAAAKREQEEKLSKELAEADAARRLEERRRVARRRGEEGQDGSCGAGADDRNRKCDCGACILAGRHRGVDRRAAVGDRVVHPARRGRHLPVGLAAARQFVLDALCLGGLVLYLASRG